MDEHLFFIIDNVTNLDSQGLKAGPRIFKIPKKYPPIAQGDGPYKTLEELKKKSKIFKELVVTDTTRVQKILKDENIIKPKNFILSPQSKSYKEDFIQSILHATIGTIKKGKVTGVHYYNPDLVKIIKETNKDLVTQVWEAEIEFYDRKTGKWYKKDNPTTFFPKDWNLTILFNECSFAYEKMVKKKNAKNVFYSFTSNNIPIELIVDNGKLKSIYPIIID